MARILDIQKRSNAWVANLAVNVINIIEKNEQQTTEFNRKQLLASKNAAGTSLIHNRTGSDKLSKAYAKRTGKTKPNIFVSGAYQSAMFMTMPNEKEYFITSDDEKVKYLPGMYDKLHGIAPENQSKVQSLNNKLVIDDYLKVFQ